MNNVGKPRKYIFEGTVSDITGKNFSNDKTAFVGNCGYIHNLLFLVTYSIVVNAEDPRNTWDAGVPIKVEKWVDVEITIKE